MVEHYLSPLLQNKNLKKFVVKSLIMFKVQSSKNMLK
jgi:CMP-N-acetylneuraminic acid synthetase